MKFFRLMPSTSNSKLCGISWRDSFGKELNKSLSKVGAWEVIGDNFSEQELSILSDRLPKDNRALHFLGLNIAGADPLSDAYIDKMKRLSAIFKPRIISDHLSWCQNRGSYLFDLLPFQKNRSELKRIAKRIQYVQDRLCMQLTLENISEYLFFDRSAHEVIFLKELYSMTGCGVLFDANNFLVNHFNRYSQESSAQSYEESLQSTLVSLWPLVRKLPIAQFHVAGNRIEQHHWIDDHGSAPTKLCWELVNDLAFYHPTSPIILEWDNNIPPFSSLQSLLKNIQTKKSVQVPFKEEHTPVPSDNIGQPLSYQAFLSFIKRSDFVVESMSRSHSEATSLIYRTNSVFSAIKTLEDTIPSVVNSLGRKNFQYCVREWIYFESRQHTLNSDSIVQSFLNFLNTSIPLKENQNET